MMAGPRLGSRIDWSNKLSVLLNDSLINAYCIEGKVLFR